MRPTALGIALQAATYGQTIPVILGLCRSSPYLIWDTNIRSQGGSLLANSGKKSGTTYAANVDFLLGVNPIVGVCQIWYNNGLLPLNLGGYPITLSGSPTSVTITDSNYYFLLGILLTESYAVTFNDFGGSGPVVLSGSYQRPLWNALYGGPDPANNSAYRNTGYTYSWIPIAGPAIALDPYAPAGRTIAFSYYQLDHFGSPVYGLAGSQIPLFALRLTFEPILGAGPEYLFDPSQQIIYPHYAGMGSPDLDIGTGQVPTIGPEVAGACMTYPTGDADFSDMVEYVFKRGICQAGYDEGAGTGTSQLQVGLNCFDFPAAIQKKVIPAIADITYDMPMTPGSVLVAVMHNTTGTIPPTLTDTLGNSWVGLLPDYAVRGFQIWYTTGAAFGTSNTVQFATAGGTGTGGQCAILEVAGVDGLDAFVELSVGSGAITTRNDPGKPALILAFGDYTDGNAPVVDPAMVRWKTLIGNPPCIYATSFIAEWRVANYPGNYPITQPAANFKQMIIVAFKALEPVQYAKPLGDILDSASLELCRLQCRANGMWGSLKMDSQRKASDWLQDIYTAMNAAPVWSGFTLKSIPRSEVSAVGNGAIYNSPTAPGPVLPIGDDDYAGEAGPPVTVKRKAQVDCPDLLQIQCPNREQFYCDTVISQPETAAIALYGPRKANPIQLRCICDVTIARMILGIMIRRQNYLRNSYKFKLKQGFAGLEPMDLISLTDSKIGISNLPVRLTSITENEDLTLDCEAEQFIYGCNAPVPLPITQNQASMTDKATVPALVNAPVFVETVNGLIDSQLWVAVSNADPNYGGSVVYLSTNGGQNYNPVSKLMANGITGVVMSDWPAGSDPDTSTDLLLDLTESRGELTNYFAADRDNFLYPSYVAGGAGEVPYELVSYGQAVLTSAYHYTLKATGAGNKLRRAVFAAPQPGLGVDHPSGSRFAFIGTSAPGVYQMTVPDTMIGQELHFKFVAFNAFGFGLQNIEDVTDYTYTPTGLVGPSTPPMMPLMNSDPAGSQPILDPYGQQIGVPLN